MKNLSLFFVAILILTAGVGLLDAPSPVNAQIDIVFEDDMENGLNGWTAEGLWHQETRRYSSPTTSWAYNTGHPKYNYDTKERNSGGLISHIIDLEDSATLEFRYWYHTENIVYWDQRRIQIGIVEDGQGATVFTDIAQLQGGVMLEEWNTYTLDLSAWANQPVQIKFFFDTMDKMMNKYEGWYIDDVVIRDQGADDLEPPTPNPPVWEVWPHVTSSTSIEMSVFPCFDPSGVEYYFFCMSDGCHDSGPLEDPFYTDILDLQPSTEYAYTVQVLDKSAPPNETRVSELRSVTTKGECTYVLVHVESITTDTVRADKGKYYGQVEVTVLDNCGDPVVSGVEVSGVFNGSYNEDDSGWTDESGVAVIVTDTAAKKPISYEFCVDLVDHPDWDEITPPCEPY